MLVRYLRRWPIIETALGECPVFAGDRADRERIIWSRMRLMAQWLALLSVTLEFGDMSYLTLSWLLDSDISYLTRQLAAR